VEITQVQAAQHAKISDFVTSSQMNPIPKGVSNNPGW